MNSGVRNIFHAAVAAGLLSVAGLPLLAQTNDFAVGRTESEAKQAWREAMHQVAAPAAGCFHASYPSTAWQRVDCAPAPAYRSALPSRHKNYEQVIGNAYDYVAQAPSGSKFSLVAGSFPTVSGVTSEKGANVPFGGSESDGITGMNEYTVQVNTNIVHTAACGSYTNCLAWQQYVISTNTPVSLTSSQLSGKTEVFIEYWLIDYGSSSSASCPSGFVNAGADSEGPGVDCVQNTAATVIYSGQLPITSLSSLSLSGSAVSGGTDKATATYGGEAYTASAADSYTDISSAWTQAEFNIFGNAGGSRADFNTGASITAKMALTDGSTTAPTCVSPSSDDGTTGETNNLSPVSCSVAGGSAPYVEFTESN